MPSSMFMDYLQIKWKKNNDFKKAELSSAVLLFS
jgi:hypothetical protein